MTLPCRDPPVIPAKAGIQTESETCTKLRPDSRFRGSDEEDAAAGIRAAAEVTETGAAHFPLPIVPPPRDKRRRPDVFDRELCLMASTHPGASPFRPSAAAARARAGELEDWLNLYLYHPPARRLARALHRLGVHAHAVSVAGMLLVWAAAAAYVALAWPLAFFVGFPLHLLWHVFDGADGDLARLNGTTSPTGELVDGVCDYSGHVPLYFALAWMLHGQIGLWAWPLALAAGASHVAQTNHAESQRRFYLWWVHGVPWLKHAKAAGDEVFSGRHWFSRTFGWMARDYLKLVNLMTPWAAVIDGAVEAAGDDPRRRARIAGLARRASRRSLSFQKLLGPNPRTLILGASMALATPFWFFLAEALVLNLLLFWSVRHHNAVGRALAAKIG